MRWRHRRLIKIGAALAGEVIGFEEAADELWKVWLGTKQLGVIDEKRFELGLIQL